MEKTKSGLETTADAKDAQATAKYANHAKENSQLSMINTRMILTQSHEEAMPRVAASSAAWRWPMSRHVE